MCTTSSYPPSLSFSSCGMNVHSADPSAHEPCHSVSSPHGLRILSSGNRPCFRPVSTWAFTTLVME